MSSSVSGRERGKPEGPLWGRNPAPKDGIRWIHAVAGIKCNMWRPLGKMIKGRDLSGLLVILIIRFDSRRLHPSPVYAERRMITPKPVFFTGEGGLTDLARGLREASQIRFRQGFC